MSDVKTKRQVAKKKLISVYLTDQEYAKIEKLAKTKEWSLSHTVTKIVQQSILT